MAKVSTMSDIVTGPVHIGLLGWSLTAVFVVLFLLCFLAAFLFPTASLAHNWLELFSAAPIGSGTELIEGVVWNVILAWIAAFVFGVVYNRLSPID